MTESLCCCLNLLPVNDSREIPTVMAVPVADKIVAVTT